MDRDEVSISYWKCSRGFLSHFPIDMLIPYTKCCVFAFSCYCKMDAQESMDLKHELKLQQERDNGFSFFWIVWEF